MEIKKANDVLKDLTGYVKKLKKIAYEYEDISYYTYERMLDNPDIMSKYLVVLNGRQIVDLIYPRKVQNLLFLYPLSTERFSKKYKGKAIAEHFRGENYILSTEEDMGPDFVECNLKASYDETDEYQFEGCNVQYVHKDMDVNMLRDAFESSRFPTFDESKIVFKAIDGRDVNKYLYSDEWEDYPIARHSNGFGGIAGFHYLHPDFEECNSLFVAEMNGVPIAAIKTGIYSEGPYTHCGLNFIDVCCKYRQMGLAKRIIREFAKQQRNYPLVLSDESAMGKKCRMMEHFKAIIPDAYNNREWEERCIKIARGEVVA